MKSETTQESKFMNLNNRVEMNKKEYIKPTMEIVELDSEIVMLAGSPNGGGMNVVDPEKGGSFDSSEDEQYSNRRRNYWNEVGGGW